MTSKEFVENLNIQGNFVSIGLDEKGQSYFMEYVTSDCADGEIAIEYFGTYENEYKYFAEFKLGSYEKCGNYLLLTDPCFSDDNDNNGYENNCNCKGAYGYCHACPYYDKSNYNWKKLIELGVITRHGDVNPEYAEFLQPKTTENNNIVVNSTSINDEIKKPKMYKLVRFLNHKFPEKPWIRLCSANGCKKNYKNTVLIPEQLAEEFLKIAKKGKYVELHKINNPKQYQIWSNYIDEHEGK